MPPGSLDRTREINLPRIFLSLCGILIPIAIFYGILLQHTINIPCYDDYMSVLAFLEHLSQLHTYSAKLGYILSAQHNEYKLIFENMVFALQYKMTGHPNFSMLSWLGNLFLLPLFFLIWCRFLVSERNLARRLMLFVPVSFLLFQLQYSETLNWSMAGLQNIPVLVFAFACIAMLSDIEPSKFVSACILMPLAVASSGNGFIVIPVGLVMLLSKRHKLRIVIWLLVSGISVALYFRHYNFLSSQQDPHTSVLHSLYNLNPLFTLSFIGSALADQHLFKYLSVVLGFGICFVIALMAKNRYDKSNPTFFYFACFLVLTAIAVSGTRSKLGFDASYSMRYKIYSDLLLILCYTFALEKYSAPLSGLQRRRIFQMALTFSIFFSVLFDWSGNKYLKSRHYDLISGVKLYRASDHRRGPVMLDGSDTNGSSASLGTQFREIIQESESSGLYRFPDLP